MFDTAIKGRAVRDACEVYLGISPELPSAKVYVEKTTTTRTYKRIWWTFWLWKRLEHVETRVRKRWHDRPIIRRIDLTRSDAAYKSWEFQPYETGPDERVLKFQVSFLGTVVRDEDVTDRHIASGDALNITYTLSGTPKS